MHLKGVLGGLGNGYIIAHTLFWKARESHPEWAALQQRACRWMAPFAVPLSFTSGYGTVAVDRPAVQAGCQS
jgi:hypothetical protein